MGSMLGEAMTRARGKSDGGPVGRDEGDGGPEAVRGGRKSCSGQCREPSWVEIEEQEGEEMDGVVMAGC